MQQFLTWLTAGGLGAIIAAAVAILKMRSDRGETIEKNEATFSVSVLATLTAQLNSLSTENLRLREYVTNRDVEHRAEIDSLVATQRREIEDLRSTHRADMTAMRLEYEGQIRAMKLELSTLRAELASYQKG